MTRTCANCVEIRDCELHEFDGKLRPFCVECAGLLATVRARGEHLNGPQGNWSAIGGAAPVPKKPRLDQLDRSGWKERWQA